ncbi:50S ribosomal protein L10 [Candidatus Saccharibacteria bacterium]|nr:50S ribosomal protein L10 [Candidatus Saccharibacteria bacterium]
MVRNQAKDFLITETQVALTKEAKAKQIDEVGQLLSASQLTVASRYPGTSVKALQTWRNRAKSSGSIIKVVKNRLFIRALAMAPKLENVDTSQLRGQLLYVFNTGDELASAQDVAGAIKEGLPLEFVLGITADGQALEPDELRQLAELPSKDQLRGRAVGVIGGPLSGLVGVLDGNLRGLLQVLSARASGLSIK